MNGVNNKEQMKCPQNRSGRVLPRYATKKQSNKYKKPKIIVRSLNLADMPTLRMPAG
jgi:hypothetical protein